MNTEFINKEDRLYSHGCKMTHIKLPTAKEKNEKANKSKSVRWGPNFYILYFFTSPHVVGSTRDAENMFHHVLWLHSGSLTGDLRLTC